MIRKIIKPDILPCPITGGVLHFKESIGRWENIYVSDSGKKWVYDLRHLREFDTPHRIFTRVGSWEDIKWEQVVLKYDKYGNKTYTSVPKNNWQAFVLQVNNFIFSKKVVNKFFTLLFKLFKRNRFPIIRRVNAGTISDKLVPVQPLAMPSSQLFYLDYTYTDKVETKAQGHVIIKKTEETTQDNQNKSKLNGKEK